MPFSYSIIKYVYFLSVPKILLLLCIGTLIYTAFSERYKKKNIVNIISIILFILWFLSVLYVTVLSREPGDETRFNIIPFASYYEVIQGAHPRRIRSNLMNIVLFYPSGLLLDSIIKDKYKRYKKISLVFFVVFIISISIETAQYHWGLGYAETDDIIHNMIGAASGLFFIAVSKKILKNVISDT